MKILVVEDSKELNNAVCEGLRQRNFKKVYLVDIAQNEIEEELDNGKIDTEKEEEITERTEDMIDKLIYELPAPPRKPAHIEKMKEFDNMTLMKMGDEMPTEGFHNSPLMLDGVNKS
jgi:hypothetical protein